MIVCTDALCHLGNTRHPYVKGDLADTGGFHIIQSLIADVQLFDWGL